MWVRLENVSYRGKELPEVRTLSNTAGVKPDEH